MPGTWARDVSDGAGLAESARDAVRSWLERTHSARLLFVRRPGRDRARKPLAFVVRASEAAPEVRRIELSHPDELGALDLARAGETTDAQLVLICGHGTRDACCALRGTTVYGALASRLGGEELWISSHQGGHRFATNALVLPAGIQFGRITPEEAPYVVARALAGRIELERYRGRTAYTQAAQAGELVVREAEGFDAVADLRLVEAAGDRVRFRSWDGREHATVVEEGVGPAVPASCGAEAEPQLHFTARLA
jgi:hypothetical protein